MSAHGHDEEIIERMRKQTEADNKAKKEQLRDNNEGARHNSYWRRYRFKTKSVEDYRPLKFNPHYPWWCSGEALDGSNATIIAYLPVGESLLLYWDDAYDIEWTEENDIQFSDRFPKPKWFV